MEEVETTVIWLSSRLSSGWLDVGGSTFLGIAFALGLRSPTD